MRKLRNYSVFSGGPGSGKTTVIQHLQSLGYTCVGESGRSIIQAQVGAGGSALPWDDKAAYRDAMLRREVQNHQAYRDHNGWVFFDRSVIDVYGYSRLEQLPIKEALRSACRTLLYSQQIFLFPPWEAIYTKDEERKQVFEEAVATFEAMVHAYSSFGYIAVEVPKASVSARVDFVLSHLQAD